MRCDHCGETVKENGVGCDWRQGRCPHRGSMFNEIVLDNYKTRYYNLINSLTNLFKGIVNKWQQQKNNKN
jgi:hypothetical protein